MIRNRLNELMTVKNVRVKDLHEKLGLSNAAIFNLGYGRKKVDMSGFIKNNCSKLIKKYCFSRQHLRQHYIASRQHFFKTLVSSLFAN